MHCEDKEMNKPQPCPRSLVREKHRRNSASDRCSNGLGVGGLGRRGVLIREDSTMEKAFESVLEQVKVVSSLRRGDKEGPRPAKTLRQKSVKFSEARVLRTERTSGVSQSNSHNKLPDSGAAGGTPGRQKLPPPQLGPVP